MDYYRYEKVYTNYHRSKKDVPEFTHTNTSQHETYHCIEKCNLDDNMKRLQGTSTELKDLGLNPFLTVKEWNARYKPIVFSGSVFDGLSFGQWTVSYCSYFYGKYSRHTSLADRYAKYIAQLAMHDARLRYIDIISENASERCIITELLITSNFIYKALEADIKDCIEKYIYNSSSKKKLDDSTIRCYLEDFIVSSTGVQRMQDLIEGIKEWLDRVSVLVPHACN